MGKISGRDGGNSLRKIALIFAILCFAFPVHAYHYFMSPTGADGNAGNYAHPWATFQHACNVLVAGDTLLVLGGTYSTSQYINHISNGTHLHPVVIKAYGDAIAYFTTPYWDGGHHYYVYIDNSSYTNWLTIDGESRLHPGTTRYFVFSGNWYRAIFVWPTLGTSIRGFTIRGIELDGSASNEGWYPLQVTRLDTFVIDNCYVHHARPIASGGPQPSGGPDPDGIWGDGTDYNQSDGSCLCIWSCRHGKITNNLLKRGNHDCIALARNKNDWDVPCRYINITGNTFDNGWGGGIYMQYHTSWCLVENNMFLNLGNTCVTQKTKPGIQVGGVHNTIRKNVFWSRYSDCIDINGQGSGDGSPAGENVDRPDSNLVYNNTFFQTHGAAIMFFVDDYTGSGPELAQASAEHNKVINNIFYNQLRYVWTESGNYWADIYCEVSHANENHNWFRPDVHGLPWNPATDLWGHNEFKNNLFRRDSLGVIKHGLELDVSSPIIESTTNHTRHIPSLANDGSGSWANNRVGNPRLLSEYPDSYPTTWFQTQAGSSCIDSGMAVIDSNGMWMRANVAGYAWNDLSFNGTAPDIGAYEYGAVVMGSGTVSPSALSFGTYIVGDTISVDSFKIKNTGQVYLTGSISKLPENKDFYIIKHSGSYSIAPNDSMWVVIRFRPSQCGALSGWVYTGNVALTNVFCSGGACTITPSTINFGNVKIGNCSTTQTLTMHNTGTGTITGTIAGDSPDFSLVSGDGAFQITTGGTHVIGVKFCPLSKGSKSFTIHLGSYFGIKDIQFISGRAAIQVHFTTTESSGCAIWNGVYNTAIPEATSLSRWYSLSALHGTDHSHLLTGLSPSTYYAIQIYSTNGSGETVISPGVNSFYIVSTANENNVGGGLIATYP